MRVAFALVGLVGPSGRPIEEVVSRLDVKIEVDGLTGFLQVSGNGHRVRLGAGLAFYLVDGVVTPLGERAEMLGGRLVIPDSLAARIESLFPRRSAPPAPPEPKRVFPPARKDKAPKLGYKLVIDPGHGGMHTGGHGYSGRAVEKNLTLDVSKRLAALLEARGILVVLTRATDRHFSEAVQEDLGVRVDITERERPNLFLSIHTNWSENADARGFEIYVPRSSRWREESERLAATIHGEMSRRIDSVDRGVKEAGFFVLRNAPCPSTLVELEFISNPQGERDMMSSDHRQKIAEALADGVLRYIRTRG